MRILLRSSLLALLALPLSAQVSISGGPLFALDSLKKATNASLGLTAGVDFNSNLVGTEIPARVGLSLATMPGKELNGLKTSFLHAQIHGDLFIGPSEKGLRFLAGLSLNNYSMTRSGTENEADPLDRDHHFPVRDAKGLKLGLRLGVEYNFNPHMAMEAVYQQTELAGKDLNDPLVRQGGINPGWLQVQFTYRF